MQDPQSLHKYLYVHGDPVQGIDPTGRNFSLGGISVGLAVAGAFTTINFLSFPNTANAPAPGDVTYRETSGDFVAASLVELVGGPVFSIGFTLLRIGGRFVANRIAANRVMVGAGRTLVSMSGKGIIWLNKIPIYTTGPLRDKAYSIFAQAAQIAGRNIDDIAERVGYTNIDEVTAFVHKVGGKITATLPQKSLDNAIPESQLLEALHEVVHLTDIDQIGYEAFEAAYKASAGEIERQTEMRAWQLLNQHLGGNIPPATERLHREFLEGLP